MRPQRRTRDNFIPLLLLLGLVAGTLLLAGDHYLLFHSFVELLTAAIGLAIFSIAWHTRRVATSDYVTFLGMWAFSTAWITIMHALTYKGVQLLPEYDANLPTQMWVIARLLQASAFLIAPVYFVRKLRHPGYVLAAYALLGALLVGSALLGWFPDAFVEGKGLTPFKIWAEWLVIVATFLSALALVRFRDHLDRPVRVLLLSSMAATMVAEFAFTLYSDPMGPANRVGHVAYLGAFSLIYVALVRSSLEDPYSSLFRQLKQRERQLGEAWAIEHDIAETLQSAMAVQPGDAEGIEVSHAYLPAPGIGRIGGDFYDVFSIRGTLVGLVIGDVCGKGLKAAATTLKARTALRAMALEHEDPSTVLEHVNAYLCRELEDDSFVTAAYGTFDTASGVLRMAIAGHPDPLICGRDDRPFDGTRSQPLGVLERLDARSAEAVLRPGDSIVLVTDGLVDAPGPEGRFGIGRLARLVGKIHCAHTADEVLAQVTDALEAHASDVVDDDVAIVVVRWAPETT